MSDLVAQLRASVTYTYMPMAVRQQLAEAADLIESLQDDLRIWKSEAADRSQGMIDLNLDRAAMGVENARLREALAIFLGHDDRFQVAVGGNPIAVEAMLAKARALLDSSNSVRVLAGEGVE